MPSLSQLRAQKPSPTPQADPAQALTESWDGPSVLGNSAYKERIGQPEPPPPGGRQRRPGGRLRPLAQDGDGAAPDIGTGVGPTTGPAVTDKPTGTADPVPAAGGQAAQKYSLGRDPYAVWSTGNGGSKEMPVNGQYKASSFLDHHSDRSRAWAANQLRNDKNPDLQAYDFTFEKTDKNGKGVAGTGKGLPFHAPSDCKVLDVQKELSGSGGYGLFIQLEDVETGRRFALHHMNSVGDFKKGDIVPGGTTVGSQGGSGSSSKSDYPTHLDIVGGEEAVLGFVQAQQMGTYTSNLPAPGGGGGGRGTGGGQK